MRPRIALAVLLFVSACSAQEAFRMPGTGPGRCLTAYLTAFNAGNVGALRQFFLENYSKDALDQLPVEQRIPQHMAIYRETGGLDPRELSGSSEDMIAVVAQSRTAEDWWLLECHLDRKHAVLGIGQKPTERPVDAVFRGKLTDQQLAVAVESYADKLNKAGLFDGVVLIEKDNQMLLRTAFGEHNGQPHRVDDAFPLASLSKMFTAIAIGQLAEQRKLDYSDPLSKYLKDYPRGITDRVTIQQCLTHTAGFHPLLESTGTASEHELLQRYLQQPLEFPQGEYHYSNLDYMLLHEVIERVTGKPAAAYISEHVFDAAGMKATDVRTTTAPDLVNFARALRDYSLLLHKPEDELLAPKVNTPTPGVDYAYGFFVRHYPNETVIGHGGGADHFGGNLDLFMISGYDVVVLSDSASPLASERVARRVRDLITARP